MYLMGSECRTEFYISYNLKLLITKKFFNFQNGGTRIFEVEERIRTSERGTGEKLNRAEYKHNLDNSPQTNFIRKSKLMQLEFS